MVSHSSLREEIVLDIWSLARHNSLMNELVFYHQEIVLLNLTETVKNDVHYRCPFHFTYIIFLPKQGSG